MPLLPISLPAGFHSNGTERDSSGRWRSGSLVRWVLGSLRPVGGWRVRVSAAYSDPPRGMIAWQDTGGARWVAGGSASELSVISALGSVSDIAPVDLTAGLVDASVKTGFGGGLFGAGIFGAPRQDYGNYSEADSWSMDTFGQYLIACSTADGRILEWQVDTNTPAQVVANAPTGCTGVLVTEERSIFALGAGGDPRRIEWCDLEDNTVWTASSSNLAGAQTLQTQGQIVGAVRVAGQSLIVTDLDAHSATYVGQPYVYQFNRVGTACGLVSRRAIVANDAGAFWMSSRGFYMFDGSSVTSLACEVFDKVFEDINAAQISKAWAINVGEFGEVWFFYPSSDATECNRYVSFSYREGHWGMGSISRTSGVDRGVFSQPIWGGANGTLYDHETGHTHSGETVYAETGPIALGSGDHMMVVTSVIPDEANQGQVDLSFSARNYPTAADRDCGPYDTLNPTDVRFTGRQVTMRVDGNEQDRWRVGGMRLEVTQGSRR